MQCIGGMGEVQARRLIQENHVQHFYIRGEYLRWDCDYCNLQSDINSTEINQLISPEQVWFLWEKYLRIADFEKTHINYWQEEYPDGVPEFKIYGESQMNHMHNSEEDNCFKTISEFKECIIRGGEPVFSWNGTIYGVCFFNDKYCIAQSDGSNERICCTPDEVLEYMLGNDRLRDVVTKVQVVSRTI